MKPTAAIALLLATGCGGQHLVLEVTSATLRVPSDVNNLRVTVSTTDQTETLRSVIVELDGDFPATVLFEVGDETPDRVRIAVEARLGNTLVESAATETEHERDTTRVSIDLDDS